MKQKGITHWKPYRAKGASSQDGELTHHKINTSDKWLMTCYAKARNKKERKK